MEDQILGNRVQKMQRKKKEEKKTLGLHVLMVALHCQGQVE